MENNREQIIGQVITALGDLKASIAALEDKLKLLCDCTQETVPVEPSAFDISLEEPQALPDEEPSIVAEETDIHVEEEMELPDGGEDRDLFAALEDAVEEKAEVVEDDIPGTYESINDEAAANVRPSLLDVKSEGLAWKTDHPGSPVHNILSAISLNDRVLFINTLFGADPLRFQEAVTYFNSLDNFADAEAFIMEHCRDWKLDSDIVYRFIMAVRRKLG